MKFFILSCLLLFSFSLFSQQNENVGGYTTEAQRDTVAIDQAEETAVVSKVEKQAQEEAPIYIMLPAPVVQAQPTQPAPIDYTQPQVGPDLYKQFRSGNYQYKEFLPQ